jgi:hypothetical protein
MRTLNLAAEPEPERTLSDNSGVERKETGLVFAFARVENKETLFPSCPARRKCGPQKLRSDYLYLRFLKCLTENKLPFGSKQFFTKEIKLSTTRQ